MAKITNTFSNYWYIYLILGIASISVPFLVLENSPIEQSIITQGNNLIYVQKFHSQPFQFCDATFKSTSLIYDKENCGQWANRINVGQPRNDCWYTVISFNGINRTIYHNQELSLNDYLKVKLNAFGTVYYDIINNKVLRGEFKRESDWTNTYTFSFTGNDFLDYKFIDDNTLVKINSAKSASISLKNDFIGCQGGFYVKTYSNKFFTGVKYSYYPTKLHKGQNTYTSIYLPTDNLGQTIVEATPYLTINGKNFYENNTIKQTYNIVPNIDTTVSTSTKCNNDNDCPINFYCQSYIYNQELTKICEKQSNRIDVAQIKFTEGILQLILLVIAIGFLILTAYSIYNKTRR